MAHRAQLKGNTMNKMIRSFFLGLMLVASSVIHADASCVSGGYPGIYSVVYLRARLILGQIAMLKKYNAARGDSYAGLIPYCVHLLTSRVNMTSDSMNWTNSKINELFIAIQQEKHHE